PSRLSSLLQSRGASHIAVPTALVVAIAATVRLTSGSSSPRGEPANASHAMAAGDTVTVWGPQVFVAPDTESVIYYWNRFTVSLLPQKQYVVHVVNGNPDGAGKVTNGSVAVNRTTVISFQGGSGGSDISRAVDL